ncbi:MAG: hypothetical protein ACKOXB_11350 [Flavobacteriales bacterium]
MSNKYKILFSIFFLATVFSFVAQEEESYLVYSDYFKHGIPTGFMGENNGKSMKVDPNCKDNPYKGENCFKITTDNTESWRGLHIQFTGAWNVGVSPDKKLPDLTPYDKLEFYARAEAGDQAYILPEIGVGGGGGEIAEEKVNDTFLEIGTEWKKYSISIKGADLARVNTLLYMTLPVGTLYLDEIRFVKKTKN